MAVIGDSLMLWGIRPPLGVRHAHNHNHNHNHNHENEEMIVAVNAIYAIV